MQAAADRRVDALAGCILGAAVGDALGLPREGLTPDRARKLFGSPPLRHMLLFGRGMVSDDAEHLAMAARALIASAGDIGAFARSLAWQMRWWLLSAPVGVGLGTLRACLRLCVGMGPDHSGVPSAGNGPAMRAPVIGAWLGEDTEGLRELVRTCTRITHTDCRAEQGALAVALCAAAVASSGPPEDPALLVRGIADQVSDAELRARLLHVAELLASGEEAEELSSRLGFERGVSGYINNTVPAALFCALAYPSFRDALEHAIMLGGDSDTTAAVTGGIAGAMHGAGAIPREWVEGLLELPGVPWAETLAGELASTSPGGDGRRPPSVALWWATRPLRGLLLLGTVLGHALRRLLPPY